jgi:hypothetical protein
MFYIIVYIHALHYVYTFADNTCIIFLGRSILGEMTTCILLKKPDGGGERGGCGGG